MLNNTKIKVAKKYQEMMLEIDYEGRDSGYWAYTKAGYQFAGMGGECHTAHEYSQKELLTMIRTIVPCDCKHCKKELVRQEQEKEINSIEAEQQAEEKNILIAEEEVVELSNGLQGIIDTFLFNVHEVVNEKKVIVERDDIYYGITEVEVDGEIKYLLNRSLEYYSEEELYIRLLRP